MKSIVVNGEFWQKRIAVLSDGKLVNIHFESSEDAPLERSFFKGKISRVLPGIQTAFVDIGQEKAGFLHITDVDRNLAYKKLLAEDLEDDDSGRQNSQEGSKKDSSAQGSVDIKNMFHSGQEVLVQVIKEPIGNKGAKLSTCYTIPGKFIVLMPMISHIGVSRKIEKRTERSRLKSLLEERLEGTKFGAIARTTADGQSDVEILADLDYLVELWSEIERKFKSAKPSEIIYRDIPLLLRVIRENLWKDIDAVVCDNQEDFKAVGDFVRRFMPEKIRCVELFSQRVPIFDHYGIERQINELLDRTVKMKSGASLVIDTTEAMTVIDVNTGKFVGGATLEETVFKTNLEAAAEIVRQIILRNIGGLIVIDFIDMSVEGNKTKLLRHLEKLLGEQDRLKSAALRVSEFGIVEMTRKRSGKSFRQQLCEQCNHCSGTGFVTSPKTRALKILSELKYKVLSGRRRKEILVGVSPMVFGYLVSDPAAVLMHLEAQLNVKITLQLMTELRDSELLIS